MVQTRRWVHYQMSTLCQSLTFLAVLSIATLNLQMEPTLQLCRQRQTTRRWESSKATKRWMASMPLFRSLSSLWLVRLQIIQRCLVSAAPSITSILATQIMMLQRDLSLIIQATGRVPGSHLMLRSCSQTTKSSRKRTQSGSLTSITRCLTAASFQAVQVFLRRRKIQCHRNWQMTRRNLVSGS